MVGQVISNKMDKTVIVIVSNRIKHKRYSKIISRTKRYYAHDEENIYKIGDVVKIQQSRPISKHKYWTVVSLIK